MQGRNPHPIEIIKFLSCFADHYLAHKRGQDYSDNCNLGAPNQQFSILAEDIPSNLLIDMPRHRVEDIHSNYRLCFAAYKQKILTVVKESEEQHL